MRLVVSVVFLCAVVASCNHYSGTPNSTWSAYSRAVGAVEKNKKP